MSGCTQIITLLLLAGEMLTRKNLVLQRTIKAILNRLQEDQHHLLLDHHHQEQQHEQQPGEQAMEQQHGELGDETQVVTQRSLSPRYPQRLQPYHHHHHYQQQQDEGSEEVPADSIAEEEAPEGMQQQEDGGGDDAAAVADVVPELEQHVLQLEEELEAARQALAVAVLLIPSTAATAGGRGASSGRGISSSGGVGGGWVGRSRGSSRGSPSGGEGSISPNRGSAAMQQQQQQQQDRGRCCSPGSPGSTKALAAGDRRGGSAGAAAAGGGGGGGEFHSGRKSVSPSRVVGRVGAHSPVSGGAGSDYGAAFEDGVAAFVLHCVQQLRRGLAAGATGVQGGVLGDSSGGLLSTTVEQKGVRGANSRHSSTSGAMRSSIAGASATSASTTAAGGSRQKPLGGSRDVFGLGELVGPAATTAAAAAVAPAGGSGVLGEGDAREQLARYLLEQLHAYSPAKCRAYRGLYQVSEPSASAATDDAAAAAAGGEGSQSSVAAAAGGGGDSGASSSSSRMPEAAAAAAAAAAGGSKQGRPPAGQQLQREGVLELPPFPGGILLSPGATGVALAAAGGPCSPPGAPQQPGIDALMAALMSDVRGWGPGLKGGAGGHGGRRGAGSPVMGSSSSSISKVVGAGGGSPTRVLGLTGGIAAAGGRVGSPGALTRGPC